MNARGQSKPARAPLERLGLDYAPARLLSRECACEIFHVDGDRPDIDLRLLPGMITVPSGSVYGWGLPESVVVVQPKRRSRPNSAPIVPAPTGAERSGEIHGPRDA